LCALVGTNEGLNINKVVWRFSPLVLLNTNEFSFFTIN